MFDAAKDKEVEAFLIRIEAEALLSIAQGILNLARIRQANPDRLKKLGVFVFVEEEYPPSFINLLRKFNPDAYKTPLTLDVAKSIIRDFFSAETSHKRGETYLQWLAKNLCSKAI